VRGGVEQAAGRHGQNDGGARAAGRLSGLGLAAALLVLAGFAGFVLYMIQQAGADEVRWARLGWLFASVEAIAFGAAGALFGASIQRQRAERAEDEARTNVAAAANGRALAAAVVADDPTATGGAARLETLGPADRSGAAFVAAEHARLARSLFPEVDRV
jgi:hypothetical protein